jgi:bacteriophage CI repressor helix-turn-helix domain
MSDKAINDIISFNLNRLLEANGKNQADLATYMEVSQATVSNWCKGIKSPRMDKLDRICVFLNCTRTDLLEDKNNAINSGLSSSDRRDIAKNLDEMMEQLQSGTDSPLMYNGQELSEASKALLRNALEYALTETKKENKVKYNPNKNKG